MHRRSAVLMVLLLAFSAQTGLLANDLPLAPRADATGGTEATTVTIPAGGEVARYLDLGPEVLEAGMTAEVEGLFDALAYMPTSSAIADMVFENGHACLLTVNGEIACFIVSYMGNQALLGQNVSYVDNYGTGRAPLSVPAAEGRTWTSIHEGHTGQSGFFCAVDDADAITCWGQLGRDANWNDVLYAEIADDAREPVVQLELGAAHACALYESGRLGCWGEVSPASGHPNNDMTFNGSLNVIEPPAGTSITDLLVGSDDSCMRVDNGELLCWGNRHGSSTPTNDSTYATAGVEATLLSMVPVRDSDWNSGQCMLFTNGSVGCYGVGVDASQRGNATMPQDRQVMTMVDLPSGTQAVTLWSPGTTGGWEGPVCADLDDGTTACWGSEYNATDMMWTALTTPTVITDVPNGTVSVGMVVGYSVGGPVVALDAEGRTWQQPVQSYNQPSNRSLGEMMGPDGYSGWYGVDLAGNILSGIASTVGTHDLTLWVNDSTGGATAYDFVIEVVDPFADTSVLYEYEIGRSISQDFDVDALCNPDYGMQCQAFFWPAAPNGISIQMEDWNFDPMMGGQWVEPEFDPKVRGKALGNVQSSDYTIVVQQWASVYGMENSPWQTGDFSNINTLALNVTLRSSTESYGRLPVASGFPFEATADFLLPFIASSESFELDGSIGGFDLNISTEDRSFETVRMVSGSVCADGAEGTSCYGSVSNIFASYESNYQIVRPTADVNYNSMAASPIGVTPIVDGDFDGIVVDGGSACWMNSMDEVVCAANQGSWNLGYLGDETTLNAMGLAPTAMWDGATASVFSYFPSYNQGHLCASLTNLTLVCNVGTNNPVLTADAGESTVWIENANVTAFVSMGYSDGLCVLAGEGDLGAGVHCAGENLYRHFVDQGEDLTSGEFHAAEAPVDGQGAPAVPTSVFRWYGACSQFENNSVHCMDSYFNSTNASRNWDGSNLPGLFTVPGMGAVVSDGRMDQSDECVLDDLGQVFCIEITTNWDSSDYVRPSHIRDLGVEVYNHTAESQWGDEWKRMVVRKVDFGGPVVDLTSTWEHMAAVLEDGRLMTIGSVPDRMGIGESAFRFGVNGESEWTSTNTTQVNPTILGLTISGTPPAGYGDSPIVSVWGNSSYGEQAEPQTGFTWNGEAANVYPFVLDYVHAVEFEHGYLEVLSTENVSIAVDVYCDWCTDFTFSPALPGDWTFDADNGRITGTPGTAGAAVTYTVTASAANGSDTTEVTIRVVDAYTEPSLGGMDMAATSEGSPQEFLVNVALNDTVLVDDEGVTSEWTITPDLPIGMHLDKDTGRIFGTPALLDDAPVAYVINASTPMGTSAEVTVWMQVVSELTVPLDTDGDGTPDSEDDDDDNDGVVDSEDAFPLDASESADLDGDGIGNNADDDADGDGVPASEDQNDLDASVGAATVDDMDGDGIPDAQDTDRDGDGVDNDLDAFPDDASETVDTDGDGTGDGADSDDDGDGVDDANDAFPLDASESADLDGDGVGDNSDTDADGDGVLNDVDQDDMDATVGAADTGSNGTGTNGTDTNGTNTNTTVTDLDGDGTPDAEDDDIDGDGVPNAEDLFPEDATESADLDGDGVGDNMDDDADGDGIPASEDADDMDASVGRVEAGSEDGGGSSALLLVLVVLGIVVMLAVVLRRSNDEA